MARNQTAVEISMGNLRVLGDKVMVTNMDFDARVTASGIILPHDDMEQRGIRPRWCRIIAKGPKQEDVEVGEWIYVAHGRWTRGVDVYDIDTGTEMTIRFVDPKDMILHSDEPLRDETVRDKLGLDGGV
jgi:co-chaperonin GroES (HSP10)